MGLNFKIKTQETYFSIVMKLKISGYTTARIPPSLLKIIFLSVGSLTILG